MRDPALAQPVDLVVHDHAAAAADDVHVVRAALAQQLDEVLEVLDVAALVGGDRDALDVLLDRGVHDLLHRAVVPEVHDLAPWLMKIRRMMLIDASCPSNRLDAVTRRTGCFGACIDGAPRVRGQLLDILLSRTSSGGRIRAASPRLGPYQVRSRPETRTDGAANASGPSSAVNA